VDAKEAKRNVRQVFQRTFWAQIREVKSKCNMSPVAARRLVMTAMAEILAGAIEYTQIEGE